MTLLTIIQRTCGSLGLPQPAAAFASTDRQTVQLIEHLYEEGESLLNAHDWSWGIVAKTFTFIAGNPQTGEPPSAFHRMVAPGDGEFIVWNDSNNTPIIGPLSASQWTEYLARGVTEFPQYWRIIDGVLNVSSSVADATGRYEYISKNWILVSGVGAGAFTADANTIEFPESLVRLGLRWRFKQAKGLDYAEDMRTYQVRLMEAVENDKGTGRTISSSRSVRDRPAHRYHMWDGTITG